MPFDPDTEIQYRKGGKIMKKTPRKFQTGGTTASAPAPKPAPKGGPKELQDEAKRLKEEARDKKQQEAAENFYEDKQRLGNKMKKGGKVRKFAEGGGVREGQHSGIDDETRARARNFARGDLEEPKTAKPTVRKAAPKAAPKATPKAPPKQEAPKKNEDSYEPSELTAEERNERNKKEREQGLEGVYPEALLPLGRAAGLARNALGRIFGKGAQEGAGSTGIALAREAGPTVRRLPDGPRVEISRAQDALSGGRRTALPAPAEGSRAALSGPTPKLPAPAARLPAPAPRLSAPSSPPNPASSAQADAIMAAGRNRAANAREEAQGLKDFYQAGLYKKGGKVAKYAKGGGIEAKGKTKGKVVKMAKGGSVRGYGISKVTNKTKYC